MRLVVIGLGSMGLRRIRLICQIDPNAEIIGIDNNFKRQVRAKEQYGVLTLNSLDEVSGLVDGVLVCTSPLSHATIINQCLQKGYNVFTEINLIDDFYEENIRLAEQNHCVLFLSSTPLYKEEMNFIKKEVEAVDCKLNYSYHIGQYLPDWHPWESYKDFFIGDKRTNGCREIMAIEFPWLSVTFGEIEKVQVLSSKNTNLEIDYKDNYLLLISHKGGNKGMIAVDVVSRKAVRLFEVFGEDLYLSWNGTPDSLKKYNLDTKTDEQINLYDSIDKQEGYSSFVIENAYKNELSAFLNQIKYGITPVYGFEEDRKVLQIITTIEDDKI